LQAPEEPKKSTEQEEKLKKLKDDIARRQEQLNRLTGQINELEI
jgi:sigma54-dependent transcription regulator